MGYKLIKKVSLTLSVAGLLLLSSCYNNNYDDLVEINSCDTSSVTYTADISPIMVQYCVDCHSETKPFGNVKLDTYVEVKKHATSGALLGVIKHEANWSPMPKNQAKLEECPINKVEAWVNQGTVK